MIAPDSIAPAASAQSTPPQFGGSVTVKDRVPGDHTKGARFMVMLPAVDN
jgi:hypothetical protein